jgi:hypothetical protein
VYLCTHGGRLKKFGIEGHVAFAKAAAARRPVSMPDREYQSILSQRGF